MRINFEIEPFAIKLSDVDGYGLSILGFAMNRVHRAIGFNIYKQKFPDCKQWKIVIYFYGFIRRFTLKSIVDDYQFVCNECGHVVWKHNLYCQNCCDEVFVTRVPPLNNP